MVLELRTTIVYESGMEIARNVVNRTFWDYEKVLYLIEVLLTRVYTFVGTHHVIHLRYISL